MSKKKTRKVIIHASPSNKISFFFSNEFVIFQIKSSPAPMTQAGVLFKGSHSDSSPQGVFSFSPDNTAVGFFFVFLLSFFKKTPNKKQNYILWILSATTTGFSLRILAAASDL